MSCGGPNASDSNIKSLGLDCLKVEKDHRFFNYMIYFACIRSPMLLIHANRSPILTSNRVLKVLHAMKGTCSQILNLKAKHSVSNKLQLAEDPPCDDYLYRNRCLNLPLASLHNSSKTLGSKLGPKSVQTSARMVWLFSAIP